MAAKNNWYSGLSQLYAGTLDAVGLRGQAVANVTAEKLHQTAGHSRQDLIVR